MTKIQFGLKLNMYVLKLFEYYSLISEVNVRFFRKEIKEGAKILQRKVEQFKPKIAVFNGIGKFLNGL